MNTDAIEKKLIEVFSANTIANIEANTDIISKAFVKDYKEIKELPRYNEFYTKLRKHKAEIEGITENNYTSDKEQAHAYLSLIKDSVEGNIKLKNGEKYNHMTLNTFIQKTELYSKWNNTTKEKYNSLFEMLTKWKDYFLSYTNKECTFVNNKVMKIIKVHLNPVLIKEKKDKENLFAYFINKKISTRLSSFFDKDNIKPGHDIQKEVLEYCQSSYGFIQLIQDESFIHPENENWSYKEYNEFKEYYSKRTQKKEGINFVILHKEAVPKFGRGHDTYKDWIDHINQLHHVDYESSNDIECDIITVAENIWKLKKEIIEEKLNQILN